ncbi:hypothetical protein NMY22_g8349 [Coprinellus aureogranulatus]|nr:hypothetical protein NMY22_g8349 [Coprinellus aureogranulatus]
MPPQRISSRLLERAKGGCTSSLWAIASFITEESCPMEPSDVALSLLKEEVPPIVREQLRTVGHVDEIADRALACICIVATTVNICQYNSDSRKLQAILPPLRRQVAGICDWLLFAVSWFTSFPGFLNAKQGGMRGAFLGLAQALMLLLKVDKDLMNALILQHSFMKSLVLIWVVKGSRGNVLLGSRKESPSTESQGSCPIVALMEMTVEDNAGCERAVEALSLDGSLNSSQFTQAIIERLQRITKDDSMDPVFKLGTTEALIEITLNVTRQGPWLLTLFQKMRYVKIFGIALNATYRSIAEDPRLNPGPPSAPANSVGLIMRLSHTLSFFPSPVAPAYRDMVAGEILQLAGRQTVAATEERQVTIARFKALLQSFGWYMYRPSVIGELIKAEFPEEVNAKLSAIPEIGPTWTGLRQMVWFMAEAHRMPSAAIEICDYQSCLGKKELPAKQCAGCSSVVYCSSACQIKDWEERHRNECDDARREHHTRCASGTWYSHFYMRILKDCFVGTQSQSLTDWRTQYPNLPLHHVLPGLSFTSTGMARFVKPLSVMAAPGTLSVEEFLWQGVGEGGRKATISQTWNRARFHELIDKYRDQGMMDDSVRLMEASFPWGEGLMVFLTIRLKKDSNGILKADYCVQRYAEIPGAASGVFAA